MNAKTISNEKEHFLIQIKKTFQDFVSEKFGNWYDFLEQSQSFKEKIFLRYKHSLTDDAANEKIEHTRQTLMAHYIQQHDIISGGYWDSLVKFENYCAEIKKSIGI